MQKQLKIYLDYIFSPNHILAFRETRHRFETILGDFSQDKCCQFLRLLNQKYDIICWIKSAINVIPASVQCSF